MKVYVNKLCYDSPPRDRIRFSLQQRWAFSATGASTGNLVSLSEQQFVVCNNRVGLQWRFDQKKLDLHRKAAAHAKLLVGTSQESSCSVGIPQGGVTEYID